MHALLFLNKKQLGAFVKSPLIKKHASKEYHMTTIDHAYGFKSSYTNPQTRVDSQRLGDNNYMLNSERVPTVVDAVLMCARQ